MRLVRQDYQQDAVAMAKVLLGMTLCRRLEDGTVLRARIVETEAYFGEEDTACHAHKGRTSRTDVMYASGGFAYVYLCYGMHRMLNFVTNGQDIADAVLIRAILPTHGEELMLQRTGKPRCVPEITCGPGKVCKALGITMEQNGTPLNSDTLWVEDRNVIVPEEQIIRGPRVGVDYAGEDALLPWRFQWKREL